MRTLNDQRLTNGYAAARHWGTLFFMAALIPATMLVMQLRTDNEIERWLGEGSSAVVDFDAFREKFHIQAQLTAVLENVPPHDPRIERWAKHLEQSDKVHHVWTHARIASQLLPSSAGIPPVSWRQNPAHGQSQFVHHSERSPTPRSVVSPGLLAEESQIADSLDPLLTPLEGTATTVWIELSDQGARASVPTMDFVKTSALQTGIPREALHVGGPTAINAALDESSRASLMSLVPIIALVVGSSFWFFSGSLWQSTLILFTASVSVLLTMASMAGANVALDLLSVALPPLIGVLHLSESIHLLHQYNTADALPEDVETAEPISADTSQTPQSDSPSHTTALGYAIRQTFVPSLVASLTTIVGMASLMVSELKPVRDFGLWASVGIAISFVVTYTLVPLLLWGSSTLTISQPECRWLTSAFASKRPAIFAAVAILAVGGVVGWTRLTPEWNAIKFLPTSSTTLKDVRWIESHCCGLVPLEFRVDVANPQDAREIAEKSATLADRFAAHPAVTHVLGPHSLPVVSSAMTQQAHSDTKRSFASRWISTDGDSFRLSALVRSETSEPVGTILADLLEECGDESVLGTGLVALIDQSQQAIYASLRDSLLLATGIITLVLMVVLRSVRGGLIALIPNGLPILVGFGCLGWSGYPLDVGVMLTASIALGIALDDSLHYLHHFRQAQVETPDPWEAARSAWQNCAWPMFQTSYLASAGLLILVVSEFRPIAYFGGLMALLLMLALVGDLVVLPLLLTTRWCRFFRRMA